MSELAAVADTHAVIWYLSEDSRLSPSARSRMDDAGAQGQQIAVASVSIVEMVYLQEKNKIPAARLAEVMDALAQEQAMLVALPLDLDIAMTLMRVPREVVPDMPDRIIAATALHLGVPLISRDARIRLSDLQTIW